MKVKAVLFLLLLLFASAVTGTVMSIGISAPSGVGVATDKMTQAVFPRVEIMGVPIDSPGFPG